MVQTRPGAPLRSQARDGDSTTTLGSLCQCLTTLPVKKGIFGFEIPQTHSFLHKATTAVSAAGGRSPVGTCKPSPTEQGRVKCQPSSCGKLSSPPCQGLNLVPA